MAAQVLDWPKSKSGYCGFYDSTYVAGLGVGSSNLDSLVKCSLCSLYKSFKFWIVAYRDCSVGNISVNMHPYVYFEDIAFFYYCGIIGLCSIVGCYFIKTGINRKCRLCIHFADLLFN